MHSATIWTAALLGLVGASCVPAGVARPVEAITLTSASFAANGTIPVDASCDGNDVSPALTLSAPPERTTSLVIVLDDTEATSGRVTHWLVYDVPATTRQIAAGADPSTFGGVVGKNDFGRNDYSGPCPPRGEVHKYVLRVLAVDAPLGLPPAADRSDVAAAMRGHVVGLGELPATFGH